MKSADSIPPPTLSWIMTVKGKYYELVTNIRVQKYESGFHMEKCVKKNGFEGLFKMQVEFARGKIQDGCPNCILSHIFALSCRRKMIIMSMFGFL